MRVPTCILRCCALLLALAALATSSFADPVPAKKPGEQFMENPPEVAQRELTVTATVEGKDLNGVVFAHGGAKFGYALWFSNGHPVFSVRNSGRLTELKATHAYQGKLDLVVKLLRSKSQLFVNGDLAFEQNAGVLVAGQPAAGFSVGQSVGKTVGSYDSPNRFNGTILALDVQTKEFKRELPPIDPNVKRPNIVVFLSDDHTFRDSSVYGSPDFKTPNMERVAQAGMTFNRAYVMSSSCAPSRAALLSGMYPQHNGSEANHSRVHSNVKKLPTYFHELGYEVVSFGKVGHYAQTPEWDFDTARHHGYHEDIAIPKAIEWLEARKSERPLVLFVGTNWPHVPWPKDRGGLNPDDQVVPPNHVDSKVTRERRAQYHAAVNNMDRDLGSVFDAVRKKLGDDTFFLHTSDHGAQWPFGKWNLYEDGIRTPLIVNWKGRIAEGVRTEAMVSWIDILPTLVDVAGGPAPTNIDGRSFLPVLLGKSQSHRDQVFTTHSGDGNNNVYPIRAVTTGDGWKYIRNIHPEFRYTSHVTTVQADTGYWSDWVQTAKNNPDALAKVLRYQQRPAEELYRLSDDPYEQKNLSADPANLERLAKLRGTLDQWIKETGDKLTVFGTPKLLSSTKRLNVITVFVDDMGWSDLSCFGGKDVKTPHIDQLAAEGMRFNRFYVASPICSPSRVALSTGQYPQRWQITSFLSNRKQNQERGVAQWLDPSAPMIARELQKAGYATGHFGKWHMGGQRDVGEAPLISEYGFQASLTNFEGLGPRILPLKDAYDGRPAQKHALGSDTLGRGEIEWAERSVVTSLFVKGAIDFIDAAQQEKTPFYVNLWPDDVHSPFFPSKAAREANGTSKRELYCSVLAEMDKQLGVLFDRIRNDKELRDNTIILFASDNGPESGAGTSNGLRGQKGWLYEGGVRSPLIVWAPGMIEASAVNQVNTESALSTLDLNRSLYVLTGTQLPEGQQLDGEDVTSTLLGKSKAGRVAPQMWRRPPDRAGNKEEKNPDLAIRDANWKFYVNYDGSSQQLYDLAQDQTETKNLAADHPEVSQKLAKLVLDWNETLTPDNGDPRFQKN
ncbi:sulfatase-like hydrolase/transferase [Planctomicrobium sp. SH527]|uniref:sulfatase-like hydrolase/transferase n=1 Tax=Planctomicrobium sp. SH527 TaxID=3448123 RepID=UPI003F5BFE30